MASYNIEKLSPKLEEEKRAMFNDFKQIYGRQYSGKEDETRYKIFKLNLARIDEMNLLHSKLHKAKFYITKFSDLSEEEYREYNRLEQGKNEKIRSEDKHGNLGYIHPSWSLKWIFHRKVHTEPTSFDWRKSGVVSPVVDQGKCGCSWAFAAAGNMEGVLSSFNGNGGRAIPLSVEQLVECATLYSYNENNGCARGLAEYAYMYAIEYSVQSNSSLPYTLQNTKLAPSCPYKHSHETPIGEWVVGWGKIPTTGPPTPTQIQTLQSYLVHTNPITVSVDAKSFQFYFGGIHSCFPLTQRIDLNHQMLLVGYGQDPAEGTYWILKNSWGTRWGNQDPIRFGEPSNLGYIFISAEYDCGILFDATSATMNPVPEM